MKKSPLSLTAKREKLDAKVEKIRAELRLLGEDPNGEEDIGIIVCFPSEFDDSESIVSRVFREMDALEASVFPITEKILKSLDRLESKYMKLEKHAKKGEKSATPKKNPPKSNKKEMNVDKKTPLQTPTPKIEEKKMVSPRETLAPLPLSTQTSPKQSQEKKTQSVRTKSPTKKKSPASKKKTIASQAVAPKPSSSPKKPLSAKKVVKK